MTPTSSILLEVCLDSVDDALVAKRCGADRIELNRSLELGGLTPSTGVLAAVKAAVDLPVIAMLRPRAGDFCYTASEFDIMRRDVGLLREQGADGLALGILTPQGHIDRARCAELIAAAAGMELVFHRAFDFTPDPNTALEQLIELGVRRVLTSGQQPTAQQGAKCIAGLVQQAAGRIEILPGAGIGPDNVRPLLLATGCRQIHGSFSAVHGSADASTTSIDLSAGASDGGPRAMQATMVQAVRKQLDAMA